jgi:hypothetical protein
MSAFEMIDNAHSMKIYRTAVIIKRSSYLVLLMCFLLKVPRLFDTM